MLMSRILADLVLTLHVCIVLFVVLGLVIVLFGWWRNWHWVRNRYFRIAHLIAIGVVVVQAWLGVVCPLTTLENYFRRQAGEATYPGSFITYWMHDLLFFDADPWVFTVGYTLFGLAVLSSFILAPPRWRRAQHQVCPSRD